MAKKVEPLKEIFVIVNENLGVNWFTTLKGAQEKISNWELDGATILKVTQMWKTSFPEKPQMEFFETELEEL